LEFTVILLLWRLCLVFYNFEETSVILLRWLVVYYSCPQAAGSLLHDCFLNQVLVVVTLNRTMLWKHNDPKTCNATRKGFGGLVCLKADTETNCARSLQRASWLPTWDELAPKLLDNTTQLSVQNPTVYTVRLARRSCHCPQTHGLSSPTGAMELEANALFDYQGFVAEYFATIICLRHRLLAWTVAS
jgi:hypothetical protein